MPGKTIRVRDDLVPAAEARASDRGHSLQGYVNLLVERDIQNRPVFDSQPVMVPIGLSEHFNALADSMRPSAQGRRWFILYEDAVRTCILVGGAVREFDDTTVSIEMVRPYGGDRMITIPRSRLLSWEPVKAQPDFGIQLHYAAAHYAAYGAHLHPDQQEWKTV